MISIEDLRKFDGVNDQVDLLVPESEAPVEELENVSKWLGIFAQAGYNPKGVKVNDFDYQFYISTWDNVPGFNRPFHMYFAARHKVTGKAQGGFGVAPYVRSHYATAGKLVDLAVPNEE